jgi:hypothetical protein
MSITMFISHNKENNPFINIFFGGGNSRLPSIVNVSAITSALASTSTLLKYVAFFYGNVIANS